MPRFFFDTQDGEAAFRDQGGVELARLEDVAQEAFGLLRDLSHRALPRGETRISASVRDASGVVVFRATMAITADWEPDGLA